jgi:hypothetical protein
MTEKVLARVISGQSDLEATRGRIVVHTATLHGYKRHRIHDADYPAVTSADPQDSVKGTVVYGITASEAALLDAFEGDEYSRHTVSVVDRITEETVESQVYIWIDSLDRLDPNEWSVAEFQAEHMDRWIAEELKELEAKDPDGKRFHDSSVLASYRDCYTRSKR